MKNQNLLFVFILLIFPVILIGQVANNNTFLKKRKHEKASFFDLLSYGKGIDIYLKTDLKQLLKKTDNDYYRPCEFSFKDSLGNQISLDLEVKPRGNIRRKICFYPPLKIKIAKKDLSKLGLRKRYNTFKIVSHCKAGKAGDQLVLKEYLAYKLLNILTDRSFKVQLTRLHYEDSKAKIKPQTRLGFIIESNDRLEDRMGGTMKDTLNLKAKNLEREQYHLMCMFQYMIGNPDWGITQLHNVKLVVRDSDNTILPIPYDFDYSGLVNAPYAVPDPNLGIEKVSDRIYMGLKGGGRNFKKNLQLFLKKEKEIKAYVASFECLNRSNHKFVKKYIASFYKTLHSKARLKSEFGYHVVE